MYKEFIRKHLSKEYGYLWEYVETDYLSLEDLLFLIPNNVKKRNHIPMTRVSPKRKAKHKREVKAKIQFAPLGVILEEIINNTIPKEWQNNQFFGKFVEIEYV